MLQEAIAQELDVHAAEAATILRHLALSGTPKPLASLDDEARQKAVDAIRSKLTPFARELVSSLQFYQTQPESLGIGEIVITGGTSHLVGLADALHQMIGVNVRVGDPLQRVVARTALDPALEATIGSLAVPIGLAIEDEAVRSVNLLPSDQRAAREEARLGQGGRARRGRCVDRSAGLPLPRRRTAPSSNRQSELDAVQAQIAALPKPKRPVIDADVAAGEAARAVALASVLGGRISWDGVLRDVSLVLPGNVSLTRLAAQLPPPAPAAAPGTRAAQPRLPSRRPRRSRRECRSRATRKDQASVARLLARLRTVPSLTNVQLESSTREIDRQEADRQVHRPRRHQAARRCPVRAFLNTKKGMIVAGAAGLAVVLAAGWFLVVAPGAQAGRRAGRQGDRLAGRARREAGRARAAERRRCASRRTISSASRRRCPARSTRPACSSTSTASRSRTSSRSGGSPPRSRCRPTDMLQQPYTVVLEGRFASVSKFLREVRKLVGVQGGRLAVKGRVYTVDQVTLEQPAGGETFPIVRATVTVNAYSFAPTTPVPGADGTQTTTTPTGTVAAGATP